MSRDIDGIIKTKYANAGDVGLGGLDLNELWPMSYSTPGGQHPQRIQFNQLFRYLSALGVEINSSGPFLAWDGTDPEGPDYEPGAVVTGSDGAIYNCLIANGPGSTIVNPVGDVTGTWVINSGRVVQQVYMDDGEVSTGTTVMPADDSIPQNTEGDEYMTLAVTPTKSTNKLKIDVVFNASFSVENRLTCALFQDSIADAIAACGTRNAATVVTNIKFTFIMIAGTTSATTFKVRCGGKVAGTTTFNGEAGVRNLGGVMSSSITITEIEA